MDQIGILQHLRQKKAILHIQEPAPAHSIDIFHLTVPRPHPRRRIDSQKRIPRPIAVFLIARHAVRVVKALQDFRPQDVDRVADVEARALVEGEICSWHAGGAVYGPGEGFGPDAG
jgi:hypothetical protein